MPNVLVIGSMNMDVTIFADEMPRQGETLPGSDFLLSPGGKGANQAVAAARMGADTAMVGCVGDDLFGQRLIEVLEADRIDARSVRREEGVSTGVACITVCGGDNRIILFNGANARVSLDRRADVEALIRQCDALLLQLEIAHQAVWDAIDIAARHGKRIFLTPAPAIKLPQEIHRKVTHLLPNEGEAGLLLDMRLESEADVFRALEAFRALGVPEPLITLGARGVCCFVGGAPAIIPGYRVKAVDTTAAGDTFTGALAVAVTEGLPLPEAVDFAQRAAAVCVTRAGAQVAIPTRAEARSAELSK